MLRAQPGVLADVPAHARYIIFNLKPAADVNALLPILAELPKAFDLVVGLGAPLLKAAGAKGVELPEFPTYSGDGFSVPSTPAALWCWLRGEERGPLLHQSCELESRLTSFCERVELTEGFCHAGGRDLTGYEDGTENPVDEEAIDAALVQGLGEGLNGGSYVAVQRWRHDMSAFRALGQPGQDHAIGRRISDNEELDDAPISAHVKRTAQESFSPEAFLLRRSMPWVEGQRGGLVFVAFGKSVAAFDAQIKRMVGKEDGVVDALFQFTRPVTGAYFWCPPMSPERVGELDLRALHQ